MNATERISMEQLSRRKFIKKSGSVIIGISAAGLLIECKGYQLRLIAYNVLKCTGFPADKMPDKSKMPSLMAKELIKYKPDIINFSESPDETIVEAIASELKMNYIMFPSAGHWPGAIITRFKILESANVPILNGERPKDLFTRHWGKAKLQLDGKHTVIIHSAHLYPHDIPEAREIRKRELNYITETIAKDAEKNNSVILMGDLNFSPELPEYRQVMNANLTDTFAKAGKGDGFTIKADNLTKRIDYIMTTGPITNKIAESRPLSEGAFITDPSKPDSFALSDHVPQFAVFNL